MNDIQNPAGATVGDESVAAVETGAPAKDQDSASQVAQEQATPDAEPEQQEQTESRSKARREARKRELAEAREDARKAADAASQASADLDRIRRASEGRTAPKQEDFANYDDYVIAAAAFAARKVQHEDTRDGVAERKQAAEKAAQAANQRAASTAAKMFQDAAQDARQRFADFDAVVFSDQVVLAPHVAEAIVYSDAPADVAYHVAKDPALAQTLSRMTPIEAARHIGRIEAQLSAPRPRIETKAPEPISPVRGSGGATRDPLKMTPAEYDAWRSKGGTF
jgi:hypothetical protein